MIVFDADAARTWLAEHGSGPWAEDRNDELLVNHVRTALQAAGYDWDVPPRRAAVGNGPDAAIKQQTYVALCLSICRDMFPLPTGG